MMFGTLLGLELVVLVDGLTTYNASVIFPDERICYEIPNWPKDECMSFAMEMDGEMYEKVELDAIELGSASVNYNDLHQKGIFLELSAGPLTDNVDGKLNYSRWTAIGGNITSRTPEISSCSKSALLIGGYPQVVLVQRQFPLNSKFPELVDFPVLDNWSAIMTFPTVNLNCTTYNAEGVPSFEKCENCSVFPPNSHLKMTLARIWRNWHDLWDFKVIKGNESADLEDCEERANWRDYHRASFLPGPARENCWKKFRAANATVLVRGQLSKGLSSDLRDPLTRGSQLKRVHLATGLAYGFTFELSGGPQGEPITWEITQLGVSKQVRSCAHPSHVYLLDKALSATEAKTMDNDTLGEQYPPIPARNGSTLHHFHNNTPVLLRSKPLMSGKKYTILVTCCNATCPEQEDAHIDVDPVLYTQTVIPSESVHGANAITRHTNRIFAARVYQIRMDRACPELDGVDTSSLNATAFDEAMEKLANSKCGPFSYTVELVATTPIAPIALSTKPQYILPGGSVKDPLSKWFNESYTTRQSYYQAFSFIIGWETADSISEQAIPRALRIESVDFRAILSGHQLHPERCGELELYVSDAPQTTLFPYYPYERFTEIYNHSAAVGSSLFTNITGAPINSPFAHDQQFIMLPPKAKFDQDPTILDCLASDNSEISPIIVLKSQVYSPQMYKDDLVGRPLTTGRPAVRGHN